MSKVTPDLAMEVIEYTFDRLNSDDKLLVMDKLQRKTRKQRWTPLINKIRSRVKKSPISPEEIIAACEDVRQKRYARKTHSRH